MNPEDQVQAGNVQSDISDQGVSPESGVEPQTEQNGQQQTDQQPIDYEKAYKNLEKDYTRKSQKLKELESWAKFQERTGVSADQALQMVDQYQGDYGQLPPQQQPTGYDPYNQYVDPSGAQMQNWGQPTMYPPVQASTYQPVQTQNDPRISQLEQELTQMKRGQQIQQLRQKFPQFDEMYSDVINLADQQGLDLETAFGRVLVDHWEDVMGKTKEQVVENIRRKGEKTLESTQAPAGGTDPAVSLSQEEIEAAQLMGMSPQEYAQAKQGMSID